MSGDNQNDDDNMLMMNESSTILTLNDRFERLNKLFDTSTTTTTTISSSSTSTIIIDNKCYNYEFLLDLLIAVYTDIQRFVSISNVFFHFERLSFRMFFLFHFFRCLEMSNQQPEIKIQVHKNLPIWLNH